MTIKAGNLEADILQFKVKVEKRLLDGIIRRILTSSFHDS
jgi:hypothetical protein